MASPSAPPLPTYTLPLVESLISQSTPSRVPRIPVVVSVVVFFCVAVFGVTLLARKSSKTRIFREDLDDCDVPGTSNSTDDLEEQLLALRYDDSAPMSSNQDLSSALGSSRRSINIRQPPPIRPREDTTGRSLQSNINSGPAQFRTGWHENSLPMTGYTPKANIHVVGLARLNQPDNRNKVHITDAADEDSIYSRSTGYETIGYGSLGTDAPSRLDLGTAFDGSVRHSHIVDRHIQGDAY